MSETDIYKNREPLPVGKKPEKKRRRRQKSARAFDENSRSRRSKNTGLRRILHLSRKSQNEKIIWGSVGIVFVVVLVIIAVWQFVIAEQLIRSEEKDNESIQHQHRIPETPQEEPVASGKEPLVN